MKNSSASSQWLISILSILALVLAFAPGSSLLIAQQSDSSSLKTAAASDDKDLPPLPLSPIEKADKDKTALRISLKDLTKMALQNNLDIAIQDTNEQANQYKILGSYGNYDPTLRSDLSWGKQKGYNTTYTDRSTSSAGSLTDSASWGLTLSQKFKTGGNVSLNWTNGRSDTNQADAISSPRYTSNPKITFTQPLLRNLRIDDARKSIKVVKLSTQTTDSQFRQQVTSIIADIQTQYWNLVSAIKDYEIKRNSVRLGQITLRDNIKRKDVGTLAPIGVTESEYDLANRELNLISSEETILRQENALRQLISNNRSSEIWSQVIVPIDNVDFNEYKIDLDTAIGTALKNRPELEQYDITRKSNELDLAMSRNNRKWQFDLTFAYGSAGTAGPQSYLKDRTTGEIIPDKFGNPIPQVTKSLTGGYGTALRTIFTEQVTNWNLGFAVNIPLRNRSLDATQAQQQITLRQTIMQRKKQEQSIQVEIRNAVQKIQTNRSQVETAKKGLALSKDQLSGEQKRFDAGLSENFKVLDRQNQLASQEKTYLDTLIAYKQSVISLQKSMYTLLESNDFNLAKGSSDKVPEIK
jgi:outer membrane protein